MELFPLVAVIYVCLPLWVRPIQCIVHVSWIHCYHTELRFMVMEAVLDA